MRGPMERDRPRWAMLRLGWWLPCLASLACAGEAVDVRVAVDQELQSLVEVVSVDSMRPGDPNAADVRIELAARTERPVHAWFAAGWFDDRGNGYGGQSGQVHAAPDVIELLAQRYQQGLRSAPVSGEVEPPRAARQTGAQSP